MVCDFGAFAAGSATGRQCANLAVSVMSSSTLNGIGPIFCTLGEGCGYTEQSHQLPSSTFIAELRVIVIFPEEGWSWLKRALKKYGC